MYNITYRNKPISSACNTYFCEGELVGLKLLLGQAPAAHVVVRQVGLILAESVLL